MTRDRWTILHHRWARGIDWYVHKVGTRWAILEAFGRFPHFRTKRAAGEVADALILAESRWRHRCAWARLHGEAAP